MAHAPAAAPDRAIQQPKRRGRPAGTGKPPESRKSATIRVRVTQAQADKFRALGGDDWLRGRIDRSRA